MFSHSGNCEILVGPPQGFVVQSRLKKKQRGKRGCSPTRLLLCPVHSAREQQDIAAAAAATAGLWLFLQHHPVWLGWWADAVCRREQRRQWQQKTSLGSLRHSKSPPPPCLAIFFFLLSTTDCFPCACAPFPPLFPRLGKVQNCWKLRPSHRAIGHICSTLKREAASSKRVKSVGWLVPRPVVPHILFFFFSP